MIEEQILLPSEKNYMDDSPAVTAVVYGDGNEKGLRQTLDAIQEQYYLPAEIIIVARSHSKSFEIHHSGIKVHYYSPSRHDSTGAIWNSFARIGSNEWIWVIPAGIKPQPGVLRTLTGAIQSDVDAVYLADREDEIAHVINELSVEPSLQSERVLWKRELASLGGIDKFLQKEAFWGFAHSTLASIRWNEVVADADQQFEGEEQESAENKESEIFDRFRIYRAFPTFDNEQLSRRSNAIRSARHYAFNSFQQEGKPLASIVIPHYELTDMLQRCLTSILEHTKGIPFEVVVVDNGSTNTSDELLHWMDDQGIFVIRNRRNEGFARAVNRGARAAKGRYIILLNNDTEVQDGWLEALVHTAQEEDRAGIVGALLLYPDQTIQHAGIVFRDEAVPALLYCKQPANHPAIQHRRSFQAVSAACTLIRKDLYERLGGMDIGFMNGWEDVDFCLRARRAGWKVYYEPNAVVIHHTEQTPGRKEHEEQNRKRFFDRWSGKVEQDDILYFALDDKASGKMASPGE